MSDASVPAVSAFDVLGQRLQAFLAALFVVPAGVPTRLAFLPSGVAVSPDSFFVDGVANPKLVGDWLATVADAAPSIVGDQVSISLARASELMRTIALFAQAVSGPTTDAARAIGRLKDLDAAAVAPGVKPIGAAPLDWYDPAKLPDWPQFTATAGSPPAGTPPAGTLPVGPPPAGPRPPVRIQPPSLWGWRRVAGPAVAVAPRPPRLGLVMPTVPPSRLATRSLTRIEVTGLLAAQAAQAAATSVTTSQLTLSLRCRLVTLSRDDWWSQSLLDAPGWCFAGEQAGSLIPGTLPPEVQVGIPVALIVTDDVTVSGSWSAADRTAADTNTHLGPWQLSARVWDSAGSATLRISGMQVVAGIYQILPTLPPASDPSIAGASAGPPA